MTTNTDPVRAQDELRMQAALLRTPEFMAQFDPDKFAGQLERIAAALASAPPSATVGDRGMSGVHTCSYECDRPECIRAQRDELRDRLEAALAQQPAAPSVEAVATDPVYRAGYAAGVADSRNNECACTRTVAVAAPQQPAGVNEAMVEEANEQRAIAAYEKYMGVSADDPAYGPDLTQWMAGWNAALAAKQQGGA